MFCCLRRRAHWRLPERASACGATPWPTMTSSPSRKRSRRCPLPAFRLWFIAPHDVERRHACASVLRRLRCDRYIVTWVLVAVGSHDTTAEAANSVALLPVPCAA
eukprot:3591955-Prymnesium_polylepis.1